MSGIPPELPAELAAELARRYDFIRPLGHGGMGDVSLWRERMLDRLVAIKVMRADVARNVDASGRFLREARIAAKLQHPGIVGLLSFDEIADTRYFVMPYVEGDTLRARLKRGPLPEDDAARIIAEIADALAYAHAREIVHRDIKPENVLLSGNPERAMIADFGIARVAGESPQTATGDVLGTPRYMSPEQCAGDRDVDHRSDIYSLGVVAYELVAGEPPFSGTAYELLQKHHGATPAPLGSRAAGVSPTYVAAVARCLAKPREDRWQSAADIADVLRSRDEDIDPPELRAVRSVLAKGALGVLAMATWGTVAISAIAPDEMPLSTLTLAWVAAIAAPCVWSLVLFAQRRANIRSLVETVNVGMRVPPWWSAWWPRRWLSPADRSRELPRSLRRASQWFVGFATAAVATFALAGVAINSEQMFPSTEVDAIMASAPWRTLATLAFVFAPLLTVCTLVGFLLAWRRARPTLAAADGVDGLQFFARLRTPELWRSAWVRQLIDRAGSAPVPPEDLSELIQSAISLGNDLSRRGWPIDPIVRHALQHCKKLCKESELEVSELREDAAASPDLNHIRARLRSLEQIDMPRPDRVAERELLRQQLSLQERRESRLSELKAQHGRLQAAVLPLWSRLRALSGSSEQGDPEVASDDLARVARALIEVLPDSDTQTVKLRAEEHG